MKLRTRYLVTVIVLAALLVGAFVPGGSCLRTVFGVVGSVSRQVAAASNPVKVPAPRQVPACYSDLHNLVATVSESPFHVHHNTLVLRDNRVNNPGASPQVVVLIAFRSLQPFPLFLAPTVLRI